MLNIQSLFSAAQSGPVEYLICGLGNPGAKYDKTHHNAGFMAIDRIAQCAGVAVDRLKYHALVGEANIGGHRVLLMKPVTYMNESGVAVGEAMRFYKLPPARCIVFSDDISLPAGHIRIRKKAAPAVTTGSRALLHIWAPRTFRA